MKQVVELATRRSYNCGLALAAFFLVAACAFQPADVTHQKGTKVNGQADEAIFRHRWWNYYERGLSLAEGRYYEKALADLRQAADRRDQDQRMARTYGMHFIDYFPHREMGVLLYETGDFDAAERELQLSMRSFPTAKARYYIDRIRTKRIEQSRTEVPPPKIVLSNEAEEIWTREDPVVVTGSAESDHFIARLTIGGKRWFQEGAEKRIAFSEALNLTQGRHDVMISATDLAGRTAARKLAVSVDRQGPMIVIEQLTARPLQKTGAVELQGTLYDAAGVRRLEVNGNIVPIVPGPEVVFTCLIQSESLAIDLTATDRLGNQTSARIDQAFIADGRRRPFLVASLAAVILPDNPAQRKTAADRDPPMITLKGWTSFQTVYVPKICLEVQVRDEGTITAVTVNRTPVLRKRSLHVIFSWFLELTEGENRIRIEARDAAGNLAVQELVIERRIPEAVKLDARHKVTLLPFETGNEPADAGTFFQDRLIDAFVTQDRFRVVERNLFDLILQEQKLSQSQLVDRRTALKIGQLAAANSIVAGSIVVTRNGIEVVSRLIDTETSEILATADAFDEVADIYDLGSLAEALALKYHRDFPLVSGIVIDRQGDTILTDLGLQEVRKQRCILIYREDDVRHPVTGTSLGTDKKIVGRARFTQVDADFSKAELLDGSPGAVQTLQKVITE